MIGLDGAVSPLNYWEGLPVGAWLIFGIILFPVYVALIAWYVGKPSDVKRATMGLGYFIGLIFALWVPFYIVTVLIGLLFFEGGLFYAG